MKRWVCPQCGVGKLAPERLAKLDSRRWCLRCSGKAPQLVERSIAGAAERAAARSAARKLATQRRQDRRSQRRQAAVQRRAALTLLNGRDRTDAAAWLRLRIPEVLKLKVWTDRLEQGRKWPPEILIRQGGEKREYSTGHAHPSRWRPQRITMTTGYNDYDDLATLIHELSHCVAPVDAWHDERFTAIEAAAFSELTGTWVTISGPGPHRRQHTMATVKIWIDSQRAKAIPDPNSDGWLPGHEGATP